MYILICLWAICFIIVLCTKDPKELIEFKRIYTEFLEKINNKKDLPEKFKPLKKRVLLTGFHRTSWGKELGYNISKGQEISVCVDSNVNSMVHVLAHELAHCTVPEYKHSKDFENNMNDIKQLMINWGLYRKIYKEKYCNGIIISD